MAVSRIATVVESGARFKSKCMSGLGRTPGMRLETPLSSAITGLPLRPTLGAFLNHWLAHVAWARLRFTTARTYAGVVVHVIDPVLGSLRVRALSSVHLEQAQLAWQRAGVKPSMRRKAIEVLRSALNHAVALGLMDENVAKRARVPAKPQRAPAWVDLDGAKRLLRDVRGHALEAAYVMAIGLGLRRGEVAGLTWADVDLGKRQLTVRWSRVETYHGARLVEPKTAASRRVLAMPEFVVRVLRRQRERELRKARRSRVSLLPGDAVLTTRNRHPYWSSYLYGDLKRRLERLKMPHMRFHDLRHTAASLMLAEGVPPRTVMEMMGHRNLAVTMLVYGHTNLRHQREAAERLDKAFRRRFD